MQLKGKARIWLFLVTFESESSAQDRIKAGGRRPHALSVMCLIIPREAATGKKQILLIQRNKPSYEKRGDELTSGPGRLSGVNLCLLAFFGFARTSGSFVFVRWQQVGRVLWSCGEGEINRGGWP